jgi:hypothetical protein
VDRIEKYDVLNKDNISFSQVVTSKEPQSIVLESGFIKWLLFAKSAAGRAGIS